MGQSFQQVIIKYRSALKNTLRDEMTETGLKFFEARKVITCEQRKKILHVDDRAEKFLQYVQRNGAGSFQALLDTFSAKQSHSGLALTLKNSIKNVPAKPKKKAKSPWVPKNILKQLDEELARFEQILELPTRENIEAESFNEKIKTLTDYRQQIENLLLDENAGPLNLPSYIRLARETRTHLAEEENLKRETQEKLEMSKEKNKELEKEIKTLTAEFDRKDSELKQVQDAHEKLQDRFKNALMTRNTMELSEEQQSARIYIDNRFSTIIRTDVNNTSNVQIGNDNVVSRSEEQ